jgi:hypothetical protein
MGTFLGQAIAVLLLFQFAIMFDLAWQHRDRLKKGDEDGTRNLPIAGQEVAP